jgi:hypothetical protein
VAVPIDRTGTASVETMKAPPFPGMQNLPRRVGKRFPDRLRAAPKKKAKKPVALKMRPAWLWQDHLGTSLAV